MKTCWILFKITSFFAPEGEGYDKEVVKVFLEKPTREQLLTLEIPEVVKEAVISGVLKDSECLWGGDYDYDGYLLEESTLE